MMGFLMFIHAMICILLSAVILMQSGRGGGLTEGFASAESMFGAKTNSFMVKATTVFASLFLITCLTLAFLSSRKERSLMSGRFPTAKESTQQKVMPVDRANSNAKPVTKEASEDANQNNPKVPQAVETGAPANPQ